MMDHGIQEKVRVEVISWQDSFHVLIECHRDLCLSYRKVPCENHPSYDDED